MSEPENFLTRWSRKKVEAERAVEERNSEPSAAEATDGSSSAYPRPLGKPRPRTATVVRRISAVPPAIV